MKPATRTVGNDVETFKCLVPTTFFQKLLRHCNSSSINITYIQRRFEHWRRRYINLMFFNLGYVLWLHTEVAHPDNINGQTIRKRHPDRLDDCHHPMQIVNRREVSPAKTIQPILAGQRSPFATSSIDQFHCIPISFTHVPTLADEKVHSNTKDNYENDTRKSE